MTEAKLAGDLIDAARDDAPALIFEEEEVWSYAQLIAAASQFAQYFISEGLAPGDRVSLLAGNDPLLVAAYYGAFRAGLIANPINTRLTPKELAYILNHAGSRCVVAGKELLPVLTEARRRLSQQPSVLVLRDGDKPLPPPAANPCAMPSIAADDGALLIYTSGTTGQPKGVLLTHANVVAAARIVKEAFEIGPDDRTLCVMPLFHTNALMFSHVPFLYAGATVVLRKRFSASRYWEECRAYRANSSSVSPTILALLMEHQEKGPPAGQTGLKYIKVASAPTSAELAARFEARFGRGLLLETYGLTETTAISTMNPLHGPRKPGSIGRVLAPQELCIVDDADKPVPAETIGEICLKGPTIMAEYFNDPANTQKTLVSGWLRTGDMGVVDDQGFVTIVGRKKEMILRGGENISPLEIEEAAMRHPAVHQAAAVGLADDIWGEIVGLAVVCNAPVTIEDLQLFCRGHLSAFKIPQRIVFVEELPRNAMGKIVRSAVRDAFATQDKTIPAV